MLYPFLAQWEIPSRVVNNNVRLSFPEAGELGNYDRSSEEL